VEGWYAVDVLANDTAPAGAAVELVSGPTDGVVEPTASPPGFRWRPGGGLTAEWTYRITDGAGNRSNTATVTIGVRLAPEPRDDAYEATDGVLLTVPAPGVLANDAHPAGDHLAAMGSARNGTTARGGRYAVAADGGVEYAPPPGFTGGDSFSYLVSDSDGDASEATVRLTVRARPEPPPEPPPGGDRPSTDAPEVTVHLHDYPAACLEGVIVVGGSALGTWLDESRPGADASRPWEFIDLHAIVPADLAAGVHEVAFRCGGATHVAGTMTVPVSAPLTAFELTPPPAGPPPTTAPDPTAPDPTGAEPAVPAPTPGPPPPPPEGSGAWAPEPSPVLGLPTWN
ncbi:Ig-like domain-containing protein, partial [Actinosynnema sp. NPDC059797]